MKKLISVILCFLITAGLLLEKQALSAMAEMETESETPTWDLTPLPDSWFDNTVFLGDSVSCILQDYCEKNALLGDALFLPVGSYSVHNAISGQIQIYWRGQQRFAQDILPETGASKVFIMLGINDIALEGGVDRTMELWYQYVEEIQEKDPTIQIFIESMLPVLTATEFPGRNNAKIDDYNDRLRALSREKGCIFVELAHYLKDETNGLPMEYTYDLSVHLTFQAAKIWAEQLKNPENYSEDPRMFG